MIQSDMIERVTITDPGWRRRVGRAQVTFGPFVNVLAGPNGSGKSSLMEAIMAAASGGRRPPCRIRGLGRFRIVHSDLVKNGPHKGYFDESMDAGFQLAAMRRSHGEWAGAVMRSLAKAPEGPHVFLIDEPENGLDLRGVIDFVLLAAASPHQIIVASHHPLVWALPGRRIVFGGNRGYVEACRGLLAEADGLLRGLGKGRGEAG